MKIYDVRGIGANLTGSFSGSFNGLFAGTVEGVSATASYVEYSNVANKPALVSGSSQITYSGLTGIPSGIVSGSAQVAGFGIFATTGSNQFNGNQAITGSLTTTGTIVAQTLNVQQVTSSIVYSSGSNIFGNSVSNTQQLTGSVGVTGSLTVAGASTFNLGSGEMRLNRTGTAEYLKLNTYYLLTDGNDQLLGSVTGATNIYAGSGASPKITIASTGAATFSSSLTVNTTATIKSFLYLGESLVENGVINSPEGIYINADSDASGGTNDIVFGKGRTSTSGGTTFMTIKNGGNVGIGTNNPAGLLEINGLTFVNNTGDTTARLLLRNSTTGASSGGLDIREIGVDASLNNASNGYLSISTNNSERMRITSAGNLIIGNTTAYGGLTISDFTSNDGNDSLAFFYRGTSGGHESLIKFYDFRGQVNAAIGNNLEDDGSGTQKARLVFKTSYSGAPTERMQITSDGKISINTASTVYHQVAIKSNGALTYQGLGVYSSSNDRWISINHTGTEGFVETENGGSGVMTPLSFKTAGETRLTIPTNGYVRLTSSSGGIQFNGDTAAANALDDYEEGTWTPVIRGSGTAGTYELSTPTYSTYTKIGRQVTVSAQIQLQGSITGGGTGYMQISGLPFSKANNMVFTGAVQLNGVNFTGQFVSIKFVTVSPSTVIYLAETVDNGGSIDLPISAISAGNGMSFTITYFE